MDDHEIRRPSLTPATGWTVVAANTVEEHGALAVVVDVEPVVGWLTFERRWPEEPDSPASTDDRTMPVVLDWDRTSLSHAEEHIDDIPLAAKAHRLTDAYGQAPHFYGSRPAGHEQWAPWLSNAYGLPVLIPTLRLPPGEWPVAWLERGEVVARLTVTVVPDDTADPRWPSTTYASVRLDGSPNSRPEAGRLTPGPAKGVSPTTSRDLGDRQLVGDYLRLLTARQGNITDLAHPDMISRAALYRVFTGNPTVTRRTLYRLETVLALPVGTVERVAAHDWPALRASHLPDDEIRWLQEQAGHAQEADR